MNCQNLQKGAFSASTKYFLIVLTWQYDGPTFAQYIQIILADELIKIVMHSACIVAKW
jgi:hypothetical protein